MSAHPVPQIFLAVQSRGLAAFVNGSNTPIMVKTLRQYRKIKTNVAAAGKVAPADVEVLGSSSLDFPEEYTHDQGVLKLVRRLMGRARAGTR